jgi:hypothetical protein
MTQRVTLPLLYDYVFPNYILPNALPQELGIVNYLHSMHSARLSGHTFFDQTDSIGAYPNILKYMFENSFGDWSASWGGSPHFVSGPMTWYVDCHEESVFLGKRKFNKYIYPIRITPHFDDFTGVADIGSRLNGQYFWKHISKEVLDDVQKGRAIIFLDYCLENFVEKSTYVKLHTSLEKSGIPKEQIILGYNSFNAQENYENWFSEDERRLLVRNFPFLMINASYSYNEHTTHIMSVQSFQDTRNTIRDNYFVLKNRRARSHRRVILYQLFSDNLLEKGDWSWVSSETFTNDIMNQLDNEYRTCLDKSKVEEFNKNLPHQLKSEPFATFETVGAWQHRDKETYQNSYFDICTETYTHRGHQSLTEKVFSPLINFQPFFFVAFPGSLKLLQDLGFKTFHPFIDESYDKEPDTALRIKMIYEEIKRLCSMSKEEIHNWYWGMEGILIHNHSHLKTIYKNDPHSSSLMRYLASRIQG